MDRRYLRTEKLLTEAMLQLIAEKPFRDITIADIVTRADIARKTFYAHYEDKQQLLWHSLEIHFAALDAQNAQLDPDTLLMNSKPLSYPIFQHVSDYRLFYRDMLVESADNGFIAQFLDHIARLSYEKHRPLREAAPFMSVSPAMIAALLSGALLGTLRWWLQTEMHDTPEQMAYRFSQIVAPGVLQSMGFEA